MDEDVILNASEPIPYNWSDDVRQCGGCGYEIYPHEPMVVLPENTLCLICARMWWLDNRRKKKRDALCDKAWLKEGF